MAKPDLVVDVKVRWRRRWLIPLVKLAVWLRLRRIGNALLWLAPLELRVGKQPPQRWWLHVEGDHALRWGARG